MKIRSFLATAFAGVLASGVALAEGGGSKSFSDVDKDGDGYISRTEASQAQGMSTSFDEADKNSDGRLDRSEFNSATQQGSPQGSQQSSPTGGESDSSAGSGSDTGTTTPDQP